MVLNSWTWETTHRLLLLIILIFLFITLILNYNYTEQLHYIDRKDEYCSENQTMEFENRAPIQYKYNAIITIYIVVLISAVTGLVLPYVHKLFKETSILKQFFEHYLFTRSHYILYIIVYAILILFTIVLIVFAVYSKNNRKPDYTLIKSALVLNFTNRGLNRPNYFTRLGMRGMYPDLYKSIVDKYTAYKEEVNKNNYYIRYDIEEELKSKFVTVSNVQEFVDELINYINIPYDIKLINKDYERWRRSNSCTGNICNKVLEVPTLITYKNNKTPIGYHLILNWIIIVLLLYYFIHPIYIQNSFYLIVTIILIILIILLFYIMTERNNI